MPPGNTVNKARTFMNMPQLFEMRLTVSMSSLQTARCPLLWCLCRRSSIARSEMPMSMAWRSLSVVEIAMLRLPFRLPEIGKRPRDHGHHHHHHQALRHLPHTFRPSFTAGKPARESLTTARDMAHVSCFTRKRFKDRKTIASSSGACASQRSKRTRMARKRRILEAMHATRKMWSSHFGFWPVPQSFWSR
jgi:hypothetical protein